MMLKPTPKPTRPIAARRPSDSRGRGFSFAEVMFAVIILGVGFIMIAAVFPVAIQETKTNTEESAAAAAARAGVDVMKQIGQIDRRPAITTPLLPATNNNAVRGISPTADVALFDAIKGDLIISTDPRFVWIPLYRRGEVASQPEPFAQIIIIVAQNRNQATYVNYDEPTVARGLVVQAPSGNPLGQANLQRDAATQTSTIDFAASPGRMAQAAATGAHVIDSLSGRIYRIGNQISDTLWELQPGSDLTAADVVAPNNLNGNRAVFIVGRGLRNPQTDWNVTDNPHEGPAQDVSIYTTYIPVVQ